MKKKILGALAALGCLLAFTGCDMPGDIINPGDSQGETQSQKLNDPVLIISGSLASWTAVEGATGYIVNVNGTDLAVQTSTTYTLTETVAGTYNIKVKAVSTNTSYESESAYSAIETITIEQIVIRNELAVPVITKNENVISWSAVEGATGYVVNVNGTDLAVQSETTYTLNSRVASAYDIKVKAINDSKTTEYSNEVTIIVSELTAPEITISSKNVTWTAVEGATGYIVNVNGTDLAVQTSTTYTLTETVAGTYNIKVKAVSTNTSYESESAYSAIETITIEQIVIRNELAVPVITKNENVISWSAVEGATGYVVNVNGTDLAVQSETTYTLNSRVASAYDIKVKAINDSKTTEYSNEVTIIVSELTAPEITISSKNVTWTAVEGATGYIVNVNGTDLAVQTSTTYTLTETVAGTYNIKVKAVSTNTSYESESAYSAIETITIEQIVIRNELAVPVITKNENVISWSAVEGATGYVVNVNGTDLAVQSETTYTLNSRVASAYDIKVKAINDSKTTEYSNEVTIIVSELTAPEITISSKNVTWTAVEGATGYIVNVNGTDLAVQTSTTYTLTETVAGTYNIKVKAVSTNTSYESESAYSAIETITIEQIVIRNELAVPVITKNENVISWSAVEGATGYVVNVNGTDLAVQSETTYTLNSRVASAYDIKVKAINDSKTTEYSNEVTIIVSELTAPEITISSKNVTWTAVEGATGYIVNVNGTDLAVQTSTTYTLTETVAGTYNIKVKAVSTNTSYESESAYSAIETITIRAQTEITPTDVFVVGDSTVCSFSDNYYLPRYGYGTQLSTVLDSKANIVNLALSGRSSKSFITENNYSTLTSQIGEGDYLIIGFGHNDEKSDDEARYTLPTCDAYNIEKTNGHDNFQYILYTYYIKMALDKGATPILCSPIVRLSSSDTYSGSTGHITADGDYAACIEDLAADTNTAYVNLRDLTKEKYIAVGYDEAKKYHAVTACKYDTDGTTIIPNYSSIDNTHINMYGAKEVAYLFANALKNTNCSLKNYVKSDITEPTATEYASAINTNMKPSSYKAVDWSKENPTGNYATKTKNSLTYDGANVGYGFVGTVFGNIGGTNKVDKFTATETSIGNYKVGTSEAVGKVTAGGDGFAYLFAQIDKDYNFTISATLKVDTGNGVSQSGFGLMLRDDCYNKVSESSILSNSTSAGFLCNSNEAIINWSRSATTMTTTNNKVPYYKTNDEATCTIKRLGQVTTCTVVYKDKTYTTTYTDFDYVAIDSNYMYAGIYATRGTVVTTSNLTLTIDGVAQAA